MGKLLALWDQVYPNLIASGISFGAAMAWHHKRMTALVRRLHERVDHLHAKVDAQVKPADEATAPREPS